MNETAQAPRGGGNWQVIRQTITVPFAYPVYFGRGLFDPVNSLLAEVLAGTGPDQRPRLMVFVDRGILNSSPAMVHRIEAWLAAWSHQCNAVAPPVVWEGGEMAKTGWEGLKRCAELIVAQRLDRQSYVVAVGGGALLDLVGLATALIHRGLRLVRVPTTVLAQNDAGVGVKNGIDVWSTKNLIGTFAPPFAVINDYDFLDLLDDTDWRGGIAEAFKVAIIKDRSFFESLRQSAPALMRRDRAAMEFLVKRCAELHLAHIREGGDPFEMGSARPLDFGHWLAHQLEMLSGYRVRHGQAVSVGMAVDCLLAESIGWLTRTETEAVLEGLRSVGLPVWDAVLDQRQPDGRRTILEGLETFREHLGGQLTLTLPRGLGARAEVNAVDMVRLEQVFEQLARSEKECPGVHPTPVG
jgi:3-dehydroquinate synthase